ncbi:MAG: hypothetical protein KIS78_20660 [Labilithrix sp.]|nr:hypothetical protein [Labilithrix sp.]MCW5834829.1 hypothetical protein [Labilithrix sp.]
MRTAPSLKLLATAAFAVALAACSGAQTTALTTTPKNPAAKGEVETRRTANQNTEVNLEVEYMAPPEKIANDATVYVVWAKPLTEDLPPQNVGSFVVGKDRKASLKTLTPYERFDLIVTPEPTGAVASPTNEPVMKAKIGR